VIKVASMWLDAVAIAGVKASRWAAVTIQIHVELLIVCSSMSLALWARSAGRVPAESGA
jgi:hypothetical protein